MAKKKQKSKLAKPDILILDTNVLVRTLVFHFGTRASETLSTHLERTGIRLAIAPLLLDEFWRVAPHVLPHHADEWAKALPSAKAVRSLVKQIELANQVRICEDAAVEAAQQLQKALAAGSKPALSWEEFEPWAEHELRNALSIEESELSDKAKERIRRFNPPCKKKNPYQLGDVYLWEAVKHFVAQGKHVWFATADTDFSIRGKLHPFLRRELKQLPGKLDFFFEEARVTEQTRFYEYLKALVSFEAEPERKAAEEMMKVYSQIFPRTWLAPHLRMFLKALPYKAREIVKLTYGHSDGYAYSDEEIARIFGISPAEVRETRNEALKDLDSRALDWIVRDAMPLPEASHDFCPDPDDDFHKSEFYEDEEDF